MTAAYNVLSLDQSVFSDLHVYEFLFYTVSKESHYTFVPNFTKC